MKNIRVKICCISSSEEMKIAVSFGASAIGLVGKMPSGPGVIPDELIKEIAEKTPPGVSTFLLTSETSVKEIIAHYKRTFTSTIQIVDDLLHTDGYENIRAALPSVKLVQVIHITDESSIDKALEISGKADALLLDSGNPNLKIKELGGTGRVHNWDISRKIVEQSGVPVFLAGGINAGNVRKAIETVQPFGVDLCSGVRTNGKLDPAKLEEFMLEIQKI